MKKLLLLLIIIPFLSFGQDLTYIPDNWFEAYLENSGMGNGIQYDDSVLTAAIDTVTYLDLSDGAGQAIGIFDLTGIEDFTNLISLNVANNQLTSLNLSQNALLTYLNCSINNNLSELDVSNNPLLTNLFCEAINLSELNVAQNIQLEVLWCGFNQLTILDVSNNTSLTSLCCQMNSLTELDISNNLNLNSICCFGNYNSNTNSGLNCVQVWDINYAEETFSISNTNIIWSLDCVNETSIVKPEINNKYLLEIIDILAREATNKSFQLHIYDDGTVEKKYLIK